MPQGHHWVNPYRSASRNITGQHGYACKNERNYCEGQRIRWAYPKKDRPDQLSQNHSPCRSDDNANHSQSGTAADYHPQYMTGAGSQRHSYTDFTGSLRNRAG